MPIPETIRKNLPEDQLLTFIWAEDLEGTIGWQGQLPWKIADELSWFKKMTWGDVVVMGRHTFDSIPNPPLPGRKNIVLSKTLSHSINADLEVVRTLSELDAALVKEEKDIHIIGGRSLFEYYQDDVTLLIQTIIHEKYPGDTQMVELKMDHFKKIYHENHFAFDQFMKREVATEYLIYQRHHS